MGSLQSFLQIFFPFLFFLDQHHVHTGMLDGVPQVSEALLTFSDSQTIISINQFLCLQIHSSISSYLLLSPLSEIVILLLNSKIFHMVPKFLLICLLRHGSHTLQTISFILKVFILVFKNLLYSIRQHIVCGVFLL